MSAKTEQTWAVLTSDYGEQVADKQAIIDIIIEYGDSPEISDVDIRINGAVIALPITRENATCLIENIGENNELYRAIVTAHAGLPLTSLPFPEWSQHWPVIDGGLNLTGEWVDSDVEGWLNYDDEAAIYEDEARTSGWTLDRDEGYAYPPKA